MTLDQPPSARPLSIGGVPIAHGRVPVVCVPLVAKTRADILDEVGAVMTKAPDVLEWRVDHFAGIADSDAVVQVARAIRDGARGTPLIVTRRSPREGGAASPLDDAQAIALYEAICAARCADFIDYELGNGTANFARVRRAAREHRVALIGSFHDFAATPSVPVLVGKFAQAKREGADVAKVAVMPHDPRDVLTLLAATWQAHTMLDMPLISMAMGSLGVVSRIAGSLFGSSLTFAAGEQASAPGQIAVDELRQALDLLARAKSRA
jgi:3-dehydroquinate dehydratase-1